MQQNLSCSDCRDRSRKALMPREVEMQRDPRAGSGEVRTDWKRVWLISAAAWMVIAIIEAGATHSVRVSRNMPSQFWMLLWEVIAHNVLGFLVTPGIYKLALVFPFSARNIVKPGTIHLIAAVSLALLNGLWHYALPMLHITSGSKEPPTLKLFLGFSSYAFFLDTSTTYVPVLVIAYMVSFYQKYREGEIQKLVLDAQLAKAQLSFLRSQLNPHFLFNALHSIGSLMHFDIDAADRMMSKLSDLLRMSLEQTDRDEIELIDELAFLDRYLEIEKVRLGTRLTITRDIADDTLHCTVPPLMLQPLVENAVIHGIAQLPNGGELSLQTTRTNGRLRVTVSNDGTLRPGNFQAPGHEKVGVRNIRERLAQMFGSNHRFELKDDGLGRVTAVVEIPIEPANIEHRPIEQESIFSSDRI